MPIWFLLGVPGQSPRTPSFQLCKKHSARVNIATPKGGMRAACSDETGYEIIDGEAPAGWTQCG
jgi:hypothetical protein